MDYGNRGTGSVGRLRKTSPVLEFSVTNPLDTDRFSETVSISPDEFSTLPGASDPERLFITDKASGDTLVTQLIDNDANGTQDMLLFQVDLKGGEHKKLVAAVAEKDFEMPETEQSVFSRFVPERTDDYAWKTIVWRFVLLVPMPSAELRKICRMVPYPAASMPG